MFSKKKYECKNSSTVQGLWAISSTFRDEFGFQGLFKTALLFQACANPGEVNLLFPTYTHSICFLREIRNLSIQMLD